LLVLSLAGNAVELAVYEQKTTQAARQRREDARTNERRTARLNNHPLAGAYKDEQAALRRAYIAGRAALAKCLHDENQDIRRAAVVDTIARIGRATYRLMFRSAQDLQQGKDPVARRRLERRWRLMMDLPDTTAADN
jgi:hypothetical protein